MGDEEPKVCVTAFRSLADKGNRNGQSDPSEHVRLRLGKLFGQCRRECSMARGKGKGRRNQERAEEKERGRTDGE